MKPVVEPLEQLAWMAWNSAHDLCHVNHFCKDYHRAWSLVRLLSENTNQLAGNEFFVREFRRLSPQASNFRVLVSGGADTALITSVVNACRLAEIQTEYVFVDRCATPCEQVRLLASTEGINIEVICGDILDLAIAPADVVVAHNFLPFFDEENRLSVIKSWRRSLKSHGTLLMSNKLVQMETDWIRVIDPVLAERRARAIADEAKARGHSHRVAEEIRVAAHALWAFRGFVSPAMTEQSVTLALNAGGFEVQSLEFGATGPDTRAMGGIGTDGETRTRAEIRAVCID